mmetsp:Transcript_16435/g.40490  ORF Transcript_16435/g.40490 Transcript_16435/m.40490 type:complete len:180 (-) Transcript_16435:1281-1820(-)
MYSLLRICINKKIRTKDYTSEAITTYLRDIDLFKLIKRKFEAIIISDLKFRSHGRYENSISTEFMIIELNVVVYDLFSNELIYGLLNESTKEYIGFHNGLFRCKLEAKNMKKHFNPIKAYLSDEIIVTFSKNINSSSNFHSKIIHGYFDRGVILFNLRRIFSLKNIENYKKYFNKRPLY